MYGISDSGRSGTLALDDLRLDLFPVWPLEVEVITIDCGLHRITNNETVAHFGGPSQASLTFRFQSLSGGDGSIARSNGSQDAFS